MKPFLAIAAAWSLLCGIPAFAQVGTVMPSLGATSSFGIVPGESVGPNGLPLGASPGVGTVPNGLTGTITVPSASSGAACSTVATSPEGTFGSPTTYDGGGMAGAAPTPATAATPGSPSMSSGMSGISTSSTISATSGISETSGTLATSGLTGMCGSGASSIAASSNPTTTTSSSTASNSGPRAGIPLGSYEIGNLGVSSAPAVPTTNVSPFAGTPGSSLAPTMPAAAPPTTPGTTTTPSTTP